MERFSNCLYNEVCDYDHECRNACKRYAVTKYMLEQSNIPKSKRKINILEPDNCDVKAFTQLAEIRENIKQFVKQGNTLYIASATCGNGKTTWAIKLMLQYFNEVWEKTGFNARGVFVNVNTFLYEAKQNISHPTEEFNTLKNNLLEVDMVVWDDIAVTEMSNYNFDLLYTIINQRVFEDKCNIFTGNILPNELEKYMGGRLTSRILEGTTIILKGKDKRVNGSITNLK